jgi:3-methyladenine DNA glycosylase AlkD
MSIHTYLTPLVDAFEKNSNAEEALKMKKYMKDRYEYYGIVSPIRKEIYREHKAKYGLILVKEIDDVIKWCWQQPQREHQYFAMDFMGKVKKKATEGSIELYEFMLTNKSWWDTVDYIAANLVGNYLEKFPDKTKELTTRWMNSNNIWLQRTCLIYQLRYKSNTDTDLLHEFITQLSESKEFFIRKAIGWALREYSKVDGQFVLDYVEKYELSGLSKREAVKWLNNRK